MIPSISVAPAVEKMGKQPGKREIALLLLMAWIIPLVIHLFPGSSVPLESYVLPLFWVTLAAVYLFGTGAGLLVGLSAPLIEYLVIGFPDTRSIAFLAIEIAVFVGVTRSLIRRAPGFWWVGPFAYVVAAATVATVQLFGAAAANLAHPYHALFQNLQVALPGLAILAFIHFVLVKMRPQPDDWDAM